MFAFLLVFPLETLLFPPPSFFKKLLFLFTSFAFLIHSFIITIHSFIFQPDKLLRGGWGNGEISVKDYKLLVIREMRSGLY